MDGVHGAGLSVWMEVLIIKSNSGILIFRQQWGISPCWWMPCGINKLGRDKIEELAKYGKDKGVALYLWYNSNGYWNDAPQTPRSIMDNANSQT